MTANGLGENVASYRFRVNAAWTLTVESAESGIIPTVAMTAAHKSGRAEQFDVMLWPGGWSIGRLGLTIPASVRRAAIQLAAIGTGRGMAA